MQSRVERTDGVFPFRFVVSYILPYNRRGIRALTSTSREPTHVAEAYLAEWQETETGSDRIGVAARRSKG